MSSLGWGCNKDPIALDVPSHFSVSTICNFFFSWDCARWFGGWLGHTCDGTWADISFVEDMLNEDGGSDSWDLRWFLRIQIRWVKEKKEHMGPTRSMYGPLNNTNSGRWGYGTLLPPLFYLWMLESVFLPHLFI